MSIQETINKKDINWLRRQLGDLTNIVNNINTISGSYIPSYLSSSMYVYSASYSTTASYAMNAGSTIDTSSLVRNNQTSSFATTGSNIFIGNETISGSLIVTGSTQFTGSVNITGSLILNGNGVVSTIGIIDSQTKSHNGAVIVGNSIYFQNTDGIYPGLISTGSQTIAGSKTFNSAGAAIIVSDSTGYINISTTGTLGVGLKIGSKWAFRYNTILSNFIIGNDIASYTNLTGNGNFFFGGDSIANLASISSNNTALGFDNTNNEPLRNLTSGSNNIAINRGALRSVTIGGANIGIGTFAGYPVTIGTGNIGIGYSSLGGNFAGGTLTGDYNTAYGYKALTNLRDGASYNVGIGWQAGVGLNSGHQEFIAIGPGAMNTTMNASSIRSIAIGASAGRGFNLSQYDTVIGYAAFNNFNAGGNQTTTGNVAIGFSAMQFAKYARYQVALGYQVNANQTTATATGQSDYNVYLGYQSGYSNLGNSNVFIGPSSGDSLTSTSNTFILANNGSTNLMQGSFTTGKVQIQTALGIGISYTSLTASLNIAPGTTTIPAMFFASGSLKTTSHSGSFEYNGSFYATKDNNLRYGLGGPIFDYITDVNNSGTGETDLYSSSVTANTLLINGDKLIAKYAGTFNDNTATGQLKAYFSGSLIADTGALTVTSVSSWNMEIMVIKTGTSTAKTFVQINTPGASIASYSNETDLINVTFTIANILKITGQAGGGGGGSNDITAKLGTVFYYPAAV